MRPNISAYFYGYSVFFDATADAASATQQCSIQADTNFLVQQLIFDTRNAAAVVASPLITCQITDTSSGMTLFDRALPLPMIAGTAQLPYLLPTPRIFPASTTISVTITNSDGGVRSTRIMFAGQKVARF